MNFKSILEHITLTVFGVALGTFLSGIFISIFTKKTVGINDFWGAFFLSPFEMSLGGPLILYHYPLMAPICFAGFILWCSAIYFRIHKKRKISNINTTLGAILWSLANILVFWAMMSV